MYLRAATIISLLPTSSVNVLVASFTPTVRYASRTSQPLHSNRRFGGILFLSKKVLVSFPQRSARHFKNREENMATINVSGNVVTAAVAGVDDNDSPITPLNGIEKVNLLDLLSACIACTNTASVAIQTIQNEQAKNTRVKEDGSFVTDADYIAQGVIVNAIHSISPNIRIIGEESAEEMAHHMKSQNESVQKILSDNNLNVIQRTNYEVRLRYHKKQIDVCPLASLSSSKFSSPAVGDAKALVLEDLAGVTDPDECYFDVDRLSVIVDPLDGTNSYANGETDVVSILIGILVDNQPYVGVIGKPFGYVGLTPMLDTSCVTIYGGKGLGGVYIAGQKEPITALPLQTLKDDQSNLDDMPRAVISSSRSKGVVHDFCVHLGEFGLIHPTPLLISGAGEKSLRLILQRNKEALWFYPKGGTYRWDIAAPDALLRCLGGIITDKFGKEIDYNTTQSESENTEGVVACINTDLHAKCISLFQQGDWVNQR